MNNSEILKILESQPDETWMADVLHDGEGHYCALGWLHKTLHPEDKMEVDKSAAYIYHEMDALLGYQLSMDIQGRNDDSRTHAEALEAFRSILS